MTEQTDAAEEMERLRASLRWHFNCHAADPDKSYASLGIENAENIVRDLLAAREAAARAEERERVAVAIEADPFDVRWRGVSPALVEECRKHAASIARTDGAGS
jgi:hypothetical protein